MQAGIKSDKLKLSVIIVNYNVSSEVDLCLESIGKVLKGIDHEIIVVDNNSTDRGIEDVGKKHKEVRFEFLKENIGFGAANNYGVAISSGKYILLLNPDTIVADDFITPILKFMDSNESVGACGPMLIYPDGRYQYSCGPKMGLIYEIAEAFMIIKLFRYIYKKLNLNTTGNDPVKVGWISAACMFINRSVYTRCGGFDKDFFLNYEDIDLCRRLGNMGMANYYFPAYSCIHIDHGSQKKDYEVLVYTRYQSRRVFSRKHYGIVKYLLVDLIHITGILIRILITFLFFKSDERIQRFKGYKKSLALYLK